MCCFRCSQAQNAPFSPSSAPPAALLLSFIVRFVFVACSITIIIDILYGDRRDRPWQAAQCCGARAATPRTHLDVDDEQRVRAVAAGRAVVVEVDARRRIPWPGARRGHGQREQQHGPGPCGRWRAQRRRHAGPPHARSHE